MSLDKSIKDAEETAAELATQLKDALDLFIETPEWEPILDLPAAMENYMKAVGLVGQLKEMKAEQDKQARLIEANRRWVEEKYGKLD